MIPLKCMIQGVFEALNNVEKDSNGTIKIDGPIEFDISIEWIKLEETHYAMLASQDMDGWDNKKHPNHIKFSMIKTDLKEKK